MKVHIEFTNTNQDELELDLPQIPNKGDIISFIDKTKKEGWLFYEVIILDYGISDGVFESVTIYVRKEE